MRIIIDGIKMPPRHNIEDAIIAAQETARQFAVRAKNFNIYKQSIDARKRYGLHYLYSVSADAEELPKKLPKNIRIVSEPSDFESSIPKVMRIGAPPVIAGMGPCGLFAAYYLCKAGIPPIIIERGADVDTRTSEVERFWNGGSLSTSTNVQFGEGGAGTFSDGKLTTRISDPRQRCVLELFCRYGAPRDILYKAKPHIGTDKLKNTVKNMRLDLIKMGARVMFETKLDDVIIKNGTIKSIIANGDEIECGSLILAIGHSARDTYEMLINRGVIMGQKAFAAGVRVEHSQALINHIQYGSKKVDGFPPADYKLAYNGADRSCYSFCMCPGGVVVNATSEDGMTAVNGMSSYARDGKNANSALVVTVRPGDFESVQPLSGVEFQRKLERAAYNAAKGGVPVQNMSDFIKIPQGSHNCVPTVMGTVNEADLNDILPKFISNTLKDGLKYFDTRMHGFLTADAWLSGVESRTSAPVRIVRGDNMQSVCVSGLYPAGEGAGYAGGIMSAAVDGLKVAEQLTKDVM